MPRQRRFQVVELAREVCVDRAAPQDTGWRANHTLVGFNSVVLQQFDGALGGQVAALLVGRAQLQRRDHFAITLQLCAGKYARPTVIDTVHWARLEKVFEGPVYRCGGDAEQFGRD